MAENSRFPQVSVYLFKIIFCLTLSSFIPKTLDNLPSLIVYERQSTWLRLVDYLALGFFKLIFIPGLRKKRQPYITWAGSLSRAYRLYNYICFSIETRNPIFACKFSFHNRHMQINKQNKSGNEKLSPKKKVN